MARSEESILRRALRRNRTEGEQRYADRNDMNRQMLKQKRKLEEKSESNKRSKFSNTSSHCDKSNIHAAHHTRDSHRSRISDSREMQTSKTSSLLKTNESKQIRHDVETSKKLVWARQADSNRVSKNQELRKRYKETAGEGMDADDLERAKLLIARDQRKQEKRRKKSKAVETTESNAETPKSSNETIIEKNVISNPKSETVQKEAKQQNGASESKTYKGKKSSEAQAKRDQNMALRLLYLKTGGNGMKGDQVERAKLLIARDEKKKRIKGRCP